MRTPLKELVSTVPTRHSNQLSLPAVVEGGIETHVVPDDPYVWPDVTLSDETETQPSPVILIAAPGAMGKSAAARNIAASLRTIYVDLARMRVGSGSLTGELTKALGFKEAGAFVDELKAGTAAIVLDSTDEAQLGAGRENYMAFLGDLLWILIDAVPAQQVILLGRRDASDTTLLGLMELGMNPPLFQIAPLSHEQACALIDRTLDGKEYGEGLYQIHRQHSVPFGVLRDNLLRDIGKALDPSIGGLDDWESVEDFLGYPPVLLALAERLAVDNPAAEQDAAVPLGGRMLRGELLQTILERILDREQEKVRARVGDSLGMAVDSPERNVLYGRDEQVSRILTATGTVGITLDVPAVLDEADRSKYEENVASFVIDHPFLKGGKFANVVFQDYARAWAVSSAISDLYSASRSSFLATLPTTGPFFTHFMHALSADARGFGQVPEDLLDDAIRSYSLGTDIGHALYAHRDDQAVLVLHGELSNKASDPQLIFAVTELSGVVILRSPLARLSFISDYSLILRGSEGGVDLGPGVNLIVSELEIEAKSLTVFGAPRGRSGDFSLITASSVRHDNDLRVSAIPAHALAVDWTDSWHQWKPFLIDMSVRDARIDPATSSQILLCLRRVFTSFRSSVQDDPSISAEKMDRVIIGSSPVFQATFAALVSLGVVIRDHSLVRVNLDAMAEYQVSWSGLRGDDPVKPLKKLLEAVASSDDLNDFKA